jgi:hypothetical protein
MTPILFAYWLTLGFIPSQQQAIFNSDIRGVEFFNYNSCTQTVGLDAHNDIFKVWTTLKTYDTANDAVSFSPFRVDYAIGLEATKGQFTAGVKHECDHAIYNRKEYNYERTETELYITIRGGDK